MKEVKQAIILAGGLGTRLQVMYPDCPKTLVPIAGKPFLQWQLDWLKRFGIDKIHLAAGHQADQIQDWIKGKAVSLSIEPEPLGTGGGLKFVEPFIDDDYFFVINGDTLVPHLNFHAMEIDEGEVSLAVTRVENAARFGAVSMNANNRIETLHEKTKAEAGWVNAGVFLAHKSIFNEIESHQVISTEKEIFPRLIKDRRLIAHPAEPPLLDMGTEEGFKQTEAFLEREKKDMSG